MSAYIGTLSFLWDVAYQWILVGGIFTGGTSFNFSNFDWEVCHGVGSTHSPGFSFTIAYWQTLSVFCLRIGQNLKGVVEGKRGMISKWESMRICYFCVVYRSFLILAP